MSEAAEVPLAGPALDPAEPAQEGELGLPPLAERVRGVLCAPWATFARHDASWGWAAPWLLVAALGLLFGVVYISKVDLAELQAVAMERTKETLPAAQRAQMEAAGDSLQTWFKFLAFFGKVWTIAGPVVGGLATVLLWGLLAFVVARLWAPPERRPEPIRCISMAAYVHLAQGIGYAAMLVGVLGGNAMPLTGPAALADPFAHPVLHAALGRLDPVSLFGYGLFAAGLAGSCGLTRARALTATALAWLAVTALSVGGPAVGALAQGGAK